MTEVSRGNGSVNLPMVTRTSVQCLEYVVVENSSVGLVMLADEVAVTVTREERHQTVLARYPVVAGEQRRVAVELGWYTIGSGKYRGQRAIEVRLDGRRVGELTHLMSRRYAPLVARVLASGGRPGCEAQIQRSGKGLEVVLRLPRDAEGAVPVSLPLRPSAVSAQRTAWGAATVVVIALVFVVGALVGNNDSPSPSISPADHLGTSLTTLSPTTVSQQTATTSASTATVAPVPSPPATPLPVPRTTTQRPAPPRTEQPPQPACDPNYTGCVPVASDVDCEGGSGNGPAYVKGPVRVIGTDIYGLDRDGDGVACDQ